MPSQEHDHSSIISLRLPDALLERLHRYLDWMEWRKGETVSRNQVVRLALTQWLDTEEEQGGMTRPDVLKKQFHNAYTSLRSGQDPVAIHRLRCLLKYSSARFDALVEQLRAESQVILHVGDPRCLSDEEQRYGYEVNGQFYISLSWKDEPITPSDLTSFSG